MPKDPDLPVGKTLGLDHETTKLSITSLADAFEAVFGKGDPFLHGEGESLDDVFSGEEQPFSREFYREQAEAARKRKDDERSDQ